jgi:hypothetical protein
MQYSLSSSIVQQKFVARKSVVGLRKLIFHICFEPLGFVRPVKLFEKDLQASALKPPRKFVIPTLNSL